MMAVVHRRIVLAPPDVTRAGARFAWRVTPETPLYQRHEFSLQLPPHLDGRQLPAALWWTIGLLCLHSHWNLLRPCTVELPVTLPPGEREFWLRLLASEASTLEAYRTPPRDDRAPLGAIDLLDGGPQLPACRRLPEAGLCAAAFSGGKDSLLQAALLCELGHRPILVPTTSPMPPLSDHLTARRREVLAEIARRRDVEVQEVTADLRSAWRNDFPPQVGYPASVNEITDTFLYTAALVAVGFLSQATHLFLASEAEVQENAEIDGRIVQHPHFMYSAATQAALASLLAPWGLRYGSLIAALYSVQVQQLLWRRYGDLSDLQYSCWRVADGEATCSRCSQCLRMALLALALGDSPEKMGIDLVRLFPAQRDWQPAAVTAAAAATTAAEPPPAQPLPAEVVRLRLRGYALAAVAATSTARVAAALFAGHGGRLLTPAAWRSLIAYARLRRRLVLARPAVPVVPVVPVAAGAASAGGAAASSAADAAGYRSGFLRQLDPLVRAPLAAIFAAHFAAESPRAHADILARSESLAGWVAAPLAARRAGEAAA